jgi:hypothetical protein
VPQDLRDAPGVFALAARRLEARLRVADVFEHLAQVLVRRSKVGLEVGERLLSLGQQVGARCVALGAELLARNQILVGHVSVLS